MTTAKKPCGTCKRKTRPGTFKPRASVVVPAAPSLEVRWLWVRWMGVPAPLRWLMNVGSDGRMTRNLKGCGCSVRLKTLWLRLRKAVQRRIVTPTAGQQQ